MTSNISLNLPVTRPSISSRSAATSGAQEAPGFIDTLKDAMEQVESMHANAQSQVESVLQGNGQDLHGALIAVEKADIAFQLMMQVRNKIVNAYQEISRMQF